MTARSIVIALALMLCATPLAAQRVADLRLGAAYHPVTAARVAIARDNAGWDDMPPTARHAIIGGVIGGLAGWLLSGMPCQGSQGSCHSAASSIAAGAVIGAVVGLLR